MAKPVFEARHDDGDRVLFTLARSARADESGGLATHVQVWDFVGHDRVGRAAARINKSPEAEFLDYEELESETTGEPPPHPGASFDDIPAPEPGVAPGVLELMLPPADFRPRDREEIGGGVRWYVLPSRFLLADGEWQVLLDRGSEELELKLTAEQYAVVRAPGPVLLSGSAGSGKTTIAVHRLAAATGGHGPGRALYVTYSAWLRDHARRLFAALLASRGDVPAAPPRFVTMEELYRSLLGPAAAGAGRVIDYPEFAAWYASTFRRADAALAWEEIRSIVKGACLDPGRDLLRRDEYESLGRKRAPLFVRERPRLHEVALRWQERLRSGGLTDEIDLCRLALARAGPAWEHVICDEAQDLAEIQMELLLRLLGRDRLDGLVLAGDPQQVINPSGFRWAEVRSALRERLRAAGRPTPALTILTRNFRSVRPLVDLAGEVLAWKRERTGRSEGDESEQSDVAGATPIRVDGSEDDLARVVAGFGPRCAVVVGSDAARARLQALLDTTRVFTVPEAKGLEFDVVVMWGLCGADPEPWRRLLDPALDLREDPHCRRALHHLYVAVTRARRHLAIHEPPGAPPVWTGPRLAPRLDVEPPASLGRLFARAASPEEWIKEADYFLERGRYRQAAECFRRAGEAHREIECIARHHEQAGEGLLAASRWLEIGRRDRAGRCFEDAGAWSDAGRLWRELGETVAAQRCEARAAEGARDWAGAATAWEALAGWTDAARCWSNAGHRTRQLRCLAEAAEAEERWLDAARRWEECEAWERAAAAWRRGERMVDASRVEAIGHQAARRWDAAVRAWREAGDERKALRATGEWAEAERRWAEAAPVWEQLGEPAAAARAWRRAGRPDEAAICEVRVDLIEGRYARAADALEQRGDLAGAAEAWQRAHEGGQPPPRLAALVLPPAAARRWVAGTRPARLLARSGSRRRSAHRVPAQDARVRSLACAVTAAEAEGRLDDAAAIWEMLGDPDQALRCRVAQLDGMGQAAAAAALLEGRGLLEAAGQAWARAGEHAGRVRCEARRLERRRRWAEAATLWTSLGETKAAERCHAQLLILAGRYAEAADAFDRADDADRALETRVIAAQIAGDRAAAIALAEGAGRPDLVAGLRRRRQRPQPARAHSPARAGQLGAVGEEQSGATSGAPPSPAPARAAPPRSSGKRAGNGSGSEGAPEIQAGSRGAGGDPALDEVTDAIRRRPGLLSREVASATGLSHERVQALLWKARAAALVFKTGATRATRYWPAGSRPHIGA